MVVIALDRLVGGWGPRQFELACVDAREAGVCLFDALPPVVSVHREVPATDTRRSGRRRFRSHLAWIWLDVIFAGERPSVSAICKEV